MPTIAIPDEYTAGLAKIRNLTPEQADAAGNALQAAKEATVKEISSVLTTGLPELQKADIRAMSETLRSLYAARTGMDLTVEELVDGIIVALTKTDNEAVRTNDPEELVRARRVLTRLLGVHPLSLVSKARDLQYEYENTFCGARIVTDIRPVFETNIKHEPAGIVISHVLKFEYHHCGRHTEVHVALDKGDVRDLIAVLIRAQEKAATLSEFALKCGWAVLSE